MSTGPEHYHDAEFLLCKLPVEDDLRNPDTGLTRSETLAAARVHATLALVAATVQAAQPVAEAFDQRGMLDTIYDNDGSSGSAWAKAVL